MNASAALGALALGVLVFGESVGRSSSATVIHLVAIALVLACLPPLARTQQRLTGSASRQSELALGAGTVSGSFAGVAARTALIAASAVATGLVVVVCSLAGIGLLYGMRGLQLFTIGPPIPDSLPLLQLAGFDAQPLARVIAAWLLAGVALGLILVRRHPRRRSMMIGALALLVLLFASDASFALARNLRLDQVLWNRTPGPGPWLEALLLAAWAALPRTIGRLHRPAVARVLATRIPVAGRAA
jgi:hypothetical protein